MSHHAMNNKVIKKNVFYFLYVDENHLLSLNMSCSAVAMPRPRQMIETQTDVKTQLKNDYLCDSCI